MEGQAGRSRSLRKSAGCWPSGYGNGKGMAIDDLHIEQEARAKLAQSGKQLRDASDYWFHLYKPQAGDIIVDIGAGRGEDVYAFSQAVGETGHVIAVEPHPESFSILRRFCELHG